MTSSPGQDPKPQPSLVPKLPPVPELVPKVRDWKQGSPLPELPPEWWEEAAKTPRR